jgi:hypothetical protein
MSRSTDILSRVFRNLKRHEINIDDILDEEIWDVLVLAQDRIISEVFTDKIIEITLVEDQDTYDLTTNLETEVEEEVVIPRANIASIKVVEIPTGWKPFNVIPNYDFVNTVNETIREGQPCIGTVIGGKLKIYPVPTEDYEDEVIKLYTYLSSSAGLINATAEPEIPNMFDEALEQFATSRFLSGDERKEWDGYFEKEVFRLRPIPNRKHHNITRPSIMPGW